MKYIRKLSKKANIFKIKNADSCKDMEADILKQEMATSKNTLSFWKISSDEQLEDAIKAVLLSTTSIRASQFIIVNDDLISKYHIDLDDKEEGITGYKGHGKMHVNFCNLTYGKIGDLLEMFKEVSANDENLLEVSKDQVKRYIMDVKMSDMLDETVIQESLKREIERYCQ